MFAKGMILNYSMDMTFPPGASWFSMNALKVGVI
jgi:hypothetical protein